MIFFLSFVCRRPKRKSTFIISCVLIPLMRNGEAPSLASRHILTRAHKGGWGHIFTLIAITNVAHQESEPDKKKKTRRKVDKEGLMNIALRGSQATEKNVQPEHKKGSPLSYVSAPRVHPDSSEPSCVQISRFRGQVAHYFKQ